jgi:hypothetical protein
VRPDGGGRGGAREAQGHAVSRKGGLVIGGGVVVFIYFDMYLYIYIYIYILYNMRRPEKPKDML